MRGYFAVHKRAATRRRLMAFCSLFLALAIGPAAAQQAPSPVLQAMKAELDRSMEKLKTQPVPPYFLRALPGF